MPVQVEPPLLELARGERYRWPLLHSALRSGQSIGMTVHGRCMWPSLRPGDRVEARALRSGEPRVGDIVLCVHGSRALAHRVVALSVDAAGVALVTCRGDATPRADAAVAIQDVLGIVMSVHRHGVPVRIKGRAAGVSRVLARVRPVLWWLRHGQ